MQPEHNLLEPHVFIDQVKNLQRLRVHVNPKLLRSLVHQDLRGRLIGTRQLMRIEGRSRNRGQRRLDLLIRRRAMRDRQLVVVTVKKLFHLRLEQVDRSRERQTEYKRNAEEACIEVPAPNCSVVDSPKHPLCRLNCNRQSLIPLLAKAFRSADRIWKFALPRLAGG